MTLPGSRSCGMNTTDRMPARAAAAATALARLPVDAHDRTSKPSVRAAEAATATTRSLNGGGGDAAVLERVRRVAALVLDPQRLHAELAGEVVGAVQPRDADLEVDDRSDRQQAGVAPHRLRAGLDRLTAHRGEQRLVVGDLERAEAQLTRVAGAEVVGGSALATGESGRGAERGRRKRGDRQHRRHGARPSVLICPATVAGRIWHLSGRASR